MKKEKRRNKRRNKRRKMSDDDKEKRAWKPTARIPEAGERRGVNEEPWPSQAGKKHMIYLQERLNFI